MVLEQLETAREDKFDGERFRATRRRSESRSKVD